MVFEEKLLEMYKSAPTGADITMTNRFKEEERIISSRKQEEQLNWQEPLPTMILPEKDYQSFDEMELEARRIMKAAETIGIPLKREIQRPRKKKTRDTRSSDLRLVNSDGQTVTFFDVDLCSLKTDKMFQ